MIKIDAIAALRGAQKDKKLLSNMDPKILPEGTKAALNRANYILALVDALGKYGWHRYECPRDEKEDAPCECGWDDIKSQLLPEEKEKQDG